MPLPSRATPVSKSRLWTGRVLSTILVLFLLFVYLGGAVATHLRADQPFYFPILFGILLWVGLVLRNDRLRILVPLQD